MPMIAMKTKRAAVAGKKYKSAMDGTGVGCGVAVEAGLSTANAAVACDP